ncbi:hypothetical protein RND71_021191 [Anisodus tanguticus]|uniref:Uncharacterized protein n=1 Tax=Anisodus tanguticus TaxID=243964 RepID=A0AAE1RWS0_9SOLA|nr:hypothetical protein RND71_021191 [Anisodus tanguticus]
MERRSGSHVTTPVKEKSNGQVIRFFYGTPRNFQWSSDGRRSGAAAVGGRTTTDKICGKKRILLCDHEGVPAIATHVQTQPYAIANHAHRSLLPETRSTLCECKPSCAIVVAIGHITLCDRGEQILVHYTSGVVILRHFLFFSLWSQYQSLALEESQKSIRSCLIKRLTRRTIGQMILLQSLEGIVGEDKLVVSISYSLLDTALHSVNKPNHDSIQQTHDCFNACAKFMIDEIANGSGAVHILQGFSHCSSFMDCIYNFNATHDIDPTRCSSFAASLKGKYSLKNEGKDA